jgi:hypothetical protein
MKANELPPRLVRLIIRAGTRTEPMWHATDRGKRMVPLLYAAPVDNSRYPPEALRKLRAEGRR